MLPPLCKLHSGEIKVGVILALAFLSGKFITSALQTQLKESDKVITNTFS